MNKQLFLCVLALPLSMCTAGTETDNPLVEFDASECKSGEALTLPSTVMRSEPGLTLQPGMYDGLYCFAWELEDGALKVDVLNYSAGCHVTWEPGEVTLAGEQLTLMVRNGPCVQAGCGSCIYDFTFEVSGVDASRPLDLTFLEDTCYSVETGAELTLPLDERPEGIVCRESRFYSGTRPICGTPHTPPCQVDDGAISCETGACGDAPLTCLDDPSEDNRDICLETCDVDHDCTLEIDSCQDGLCRLRETF